MSKSLTKRWTRGLMDLRADEKGSEGTEVIMILVLVVVGLLGIFFLIKNTLFEKASNVQQCLEDIKKTQCQ